MGAHALTSGRQWTVTLCLLLTTFAVPSFAAFSSRDKGTTTAAFLRLGVGARAVAMGEAYTAAADDATGLYWNPAALTRLPSHGGGATFMHAPYIESTYFDYAAFTQGLGRAGAWGGGAQYFTAGRITRTDRTGADIGDFTPNDLAGTLGYAFNFGVFSLGASAKYIRSTIIDSADAFAADIGLLTPALWSERLRFAFVAKNLGSQMKFDRQKEDLPLELTAGSSLQVTRHWLTTADVGFPRDNNPFLALGTEYQWLLGAESALAGRLGFNSRTVDDVQGFNGVSLGLGFLIKKVSFDYAFLPFGQLGLTHRISLSLKWGSDEASGPSVSLRSEHRAELTSPLARPSGDERTCEELYGAENCRLPEHGPHDDARQEQPAPQPW